jgi:nucleotide-binding universal stress UspA family protein
VQEVAGTRGTIVVGVDGTGASLDGLRWGIGWARHTGQRLEVRTVRTSSPATSEDTTAMLSGALRAAGIPDPSTVDCVVVDDEEVDHGLVTLSGEATLVLGARPHDGLARVLHRSVSAMCAGDAVAPVIIVPVGATAPGGDPLRIMVGVDGSTPSVAALRYAAAHRRLDEPVAALHYWQPKRRRSASTASGSFAVAAEHADRAVGLVEATVEAAGLEPASVQVLAREGSAQDGFDRIAEEVDLLVLGQHSISTWDRLVSGSVAGHVARHPAVPTAFVPEV